MRYVLDAHAVIWFLEKNSRLSRTARAAMVAPDAELTIPSIVIAEVFHLHQRHRVATSPDDVRAKLLGASNVSLAALDDAVLRRLPLGLELHDAIIVATTLVQQALYGQPVPLITHDAEITGSGLVNTLW